MKGPDRVSPQYPELSFGPFGPIAFVVEAAGDEELEKGLPLTGPEGRVFNALLRTAGIERAYTFITTIYDGEDSNLDDAAGRIRAELSAVQPAIVVPLGKVALKLLANDNRIDTFRGTVMKGTGQFSDLKLLPTLEPWRVMKQWKLFSIVVGDLTRAASEAARGKEIVYAKKRLLLEPQLKDVKDFLRGPCMSSDLLSVDIETGWGQITCIGFAPDQTTAMCVPFVDFRKPSRSYWGSPELELQAWKEVKAVCESDVPKLGQNMLYDIFWLYEKLRIEMRNYQHDTRLLHHALYAELPKDLGFMGAAYTTQGAWKQWGGKASEDKKDN